MLTGTNPQFEGSQDLLSIEKTLVFSDDGTRFNGTTQWTLDFAGTDPPESCSGTSELVGTVQ